MDTGETYFMHELSSLQVYSQNLMWKNEKKDHRGNQRRKIP